MFVRSFQEGEPFRCAGNDFVMLLPRDLTDCCEVVKQTVGPRGKTPPNAHDTFLQVYLVLHGAADVRIGGESRLVEAPAIALIPPKTEHWVENTSDDRDLTYLYISVWPQGIPSNEKDGGWRKVYQAIIEDYAGRGYPQDGPAA
jgi:quercetin dioxygenase-like cupin family protein